MKETRRQFSPRSQASIIRQQELEKQRTDALRQIERYKDRVREEEVSKERLAKAALQGEGWAHVNLERCVEELRNKREALAAREEVVRGFESEIDACQPTPEQAAARLRTQEALAQAAEERLGVDEKIEASLAQLRQVLDQRAELTGRMSALASELELGIGLDRQRFEKLEAALPEAILPQSRSWLGNLLGQPESPVRCIARGSIVIGETLADSGVHETGDVLELDPRDFAELRRTDRAAATIDKPWACDPQSVWTPEEYKTAQSQAEAQGCTIEDIIILQDAEADAANKERFMEKKRRLVSVKVLRGEVLCDSQWIFSGKVGQLPYSVAEDLAHQGQVQILDA